MLTRFFATLAVGAIAMAASVPASASVSVVAGARPFYGDLSVQLIDSISYDTVGNSRAVHVENGASTYTPLAGYQPSATTSAAQANATAWSYANDETGAMRGAAAATGYGMAWFENDLSDRLTFSVAGAAADTVTQIVLNVRYLATISGDASHNLVIDLNAPFGGGSGGGRTSIDFRTGPNAGQVTGLSYDNGAVISLPVTTDGDAFTLSYTYQMTFNLFGPSAIVDFQARSIGTTTGGRVDFGNSAHLALALPEGVSFTSAGGTTLTQTEASVPEPAMLGLFGLGALGLGLTRRRKA